MIIRKWAAATSLAVATALLVTGCATGAADDEGQGASLTMLASVTPTQPKEFWEELVAPFEEEHGVEVTIVPPVGEGGVNAALTTELAAGRGPDIVEGAFYSDGLAELLATFDDDEWAQETPMADNFVVNGSRYQVNVGVQPQSVVYYSKAAFEAAGIDEFPTTLDEMTDVMEKLKAAGYLPLRTAGDGWVSAGQFQAMANPSLFDPNKHWFAARNEGEVTFAGSAYETFFEQWKEWIDLGYIDPNALGVSYEQGQTDFLEGRAGMYVMGAWFTAVAEGTDQEDEFGAFSVPAMNEDGLYPTPMTATPAGAYMVFKGENEAVAKELAQYLTNDPAAIEAQLTANGNYRPGFDREVSSLGAEVGELLNNAPYFVPPAQGYGSDLPPDGFNPEFYTTVERIYLGDSPKQIVDSLDEWWDSQP